MPQTYWTKKVRQIFLTLSRRGKISIRDLMAAMNLSGDTARSGLMQSLGRLRRARLVEADASAPRNLPRYSLTPVGMQAWEEVVKAARERACEFFDVLEEIHPAKNPSSQRSPAPATPSLPSRSLDILICPHCKAKNDAVDLLEIQKGGVKPTCAGCGRDLTSTLARFEAS